MTIDTNRRIALLDSLGKWIALNDTPWQEAKVRAENKNPWFTSEHIELAAANIASEFLEEAKLKAWVANYQLPVAPKTIGIVMAGNIPMVGFHDLVCGFVSGHYLKLKVSSKDEVLIPFLLRKMGEWEPEVMEQITIEERLNGCDAYIATGSNNTARYFKQYFGKYPNIIRRNRTSVAVLDGSESDEELGMLADDVYDYYGLGCRNVTQVCVPKDYDFVPLLNAFRKYNSYADLNKYKNNYDYHLAIYMLNRVQYMSNESLLMVENELPFSAVSVLHYRFYEDKAALADQLRSNEDIQAIVGKGFIPFGDSQKPALSDYADNADTMEFLCSLA